MFDARDLLGRLFDSDIAKTAKERINHALGPSGLAGGSGQLSEVFAKVSEQARSGLGGLADEAEGFYGKARDAVQKGSPLAIGGLAAVAGALLGGGGGALKGALGGGLLAVLGSVAMKALRGEDQAPGGEGAPAGLREPATAAEENAQQATARLMIRAMIEAAKADGEIDDDERARILGKLAESGADEAQRAFVLAEMQKPLDLDALVRDVPSREVGVQVYAASLLAINVDTPAEADYMQRLAAALGLDEAAVTGVHQALGV
jgi:uncharacterized membrane protein YebE (DUF533 family)